MRGSEGVCVDLMGCEGAEGFEGWSGGSNGVENSASEPKKPRVISTNIKIFARKTDKTFRRDCGKYSPAGSTQGR